MLLLILMGCLLYESKFYITNICRYFDIFHKCYNIAICEEIFRSAATELEPFALLLYYIIFIVVKLYGSVVLNYKVLFDKVVYLLGTWVSPALPWRPID